uniref:Uncharacterized protein n=1 Tax=Oryzias sinensis TaxID=183150 RepID=A0A8C8DKK7_9TELE
MSRLGRGGRADSLAGFRPRIIDEEEVPAGLLKAARKSGQLNLSGRAGDAVLGVIGSISLPPNTTG